MNTKRLFVVAALVAVMATLVVAGAAMAQTVTPPAPGAGNGYGVGRMGGMGGMLGGAGMRGAWGGPDNSALVVVADVLDMERTDLIAELQDGPKSVAQVAAAHNVALDTIVDAVVAPRADHLADLVTAGTITQAQADQMLATMRAQVQSMFNQPFAPRGAGNGAGWTDADGDGACDNFGGTPAAGRMGGRAAGRMGRWQQR